jgi:hypothetical protein
MKINFKTTGFFPTLALLTASFLAPVVAADPETTPPGFAVTPAVIRVDAGLTGADLQQALDLLPAAGGEVDLPSGIFVIRQPVVLRRDNQTLRGAGAATVLRLADNANCPVIIMGEPVNQPRLTVRHLRVGDLAIDGNRLHQRHEEWQLTIAGSEIRNNGITVQDVSDSVVKNVSCAHCRSGGLVTTLGVQRLTVQHLEAYDNEFDGLACYWTTDCRFSDLNLHDNPGAGISLDLAFNHNSVVNAVLTGNDLGIFMRSSRGNRFQNISVRRSRHFGVFIAQADIATPHGWQPVANSACIDNTFLNFSATNCGAAAFHVNDSACINNVCTGPGLGVALHTGILATASKAF